MKEDDDPDKLPCFGASLDESDIQQKKDDIEIEVESFKISEVNF